jgi:exodeoxyribonuclease-5
MRFGDVISSVASEISKGIIDPTLVELKRENNYNSTNKEGIIFINDEYETLIMASNDFKLNPKSTKLITYNNHKNSQPQSVLNLNIKIRELIYPNATSPIMPNEVFTLYNPFMDKDNDEKILAQNSESFVVKTYHKKTKEINISVYSHKMGRREFNAKYVDVFQSECVFDNKNLDLELIFDPQYKKDLSDIAKTADWQLFYSLQKQFPQIEYGYCITTHRAQGSGYDNIYIFEDNIVSSPQTSENIYRTFYTAVTRAKKKLVIQSLWN